MSLSIIILVLQFLLAILSKSIIYQVSITPDKSSQQKLVALDVTDLVDDYGWAGRFTVDYWPSLRDYWTNQSYITLEPLPTNYMAFFYDPIRQFVMLDGTTSFDLFFDISSFYNMQDAGFYRIKARMASISYIKSRRNVNLTHTVSMSIQESNYPLFHLQYSRFKKMSTFNYNAQIDFPFVQGLLTDKGMSVLFVDVGADMKIHKPFVS